MEPKKYQNGWRKTQDFNNGSQTSQESKKQLETASNDSNKKPLQNFRDLKIWQVGKEIVAEVYKITRALPNEELHGLTNQMRSTAVAIPSRISEGHSRRSARDYQQLLKIAAGSCAELATQIEVAVELGYLTAAICEKIMEKIDHETRMLNKLISMLAENLRQHPSRQGGSQGSVQDKDRSQSSLKI